METIYEETDYYEVSYDEICLHFGIGKIEDRFKFLYDKMQEYIKTKDIEDKVTIDPDILSQAIVDYFADIHRLKIFHGIERVNKSKIVSYEIFWLLKRKPIQKISSDNCASLKFVNEAFLTVFIAHEFLMPNDSAPLSEQQQNEFLRFLKHINYCMKYRQIDRQWLETVLYSVEIGKSVLV